jgi:oligopeptide transport system substrate-binding protein
MFRIGIFILIILSLALGFLYHPGKGGIEATDLTPTYGGVYRRAFADHFIVLDPADIKDSNSHEVARQIFDSLVGFDAKGNVTPSIARAWSISQDKLVYVFELREDVKFHQRVCGEATENGGRCVEAKDVLYTFKRLLGPNRGYQNSLFWVIKGAQEYTEGEAKEITGIKILDPYRIEFTLNRPFSPFVSLLALGNAFILPQEDAEKESFVHCPVGTGPFVWAGKSGGTICLDANEAYFLGRPWLDRVEFPIIIDENKRVSDFMEGQLSQVDVPDSIYKRVKKDPELLPYLKEANLWGVNFLGFNLETPPFDNVWVRRAFSHAIDRKNIVKLVLNDRAVVAEGMLPPGMLGIEHEQVGYEYHIEKAKDCLRKAGYSESNRLPEISLTYNSDPIHTRMAEFVQANLRDIGVECKLKSLDFASYLDQIEKGETAFFRMGWTADYPDPDALLYTLFHSSNIDVSYNFTRLHNEKLDKLLDQARFETKPEDRDKLYSEADRLIREEAPGVFLYFYTASILIKPQVRGFAIGPMGEAIIEYRHLWLSSTSNER